MNIILTYNTFYIHCLRFMSSAHLPRVSILNTVCARAQIGIPPRVGWMLDITFHYVHGYRITILMNKYEYIRCATGHDNERGENYTMYLDWHEF